MTPDERAHAIVVQDGGTDYYYEGWAREDSIACAIEEAEQEALAKALDILARYSVAKGDACDKAADEIEALLGSEGK